MAKIKELVSYVRSKNAGPFWLTMDLFFDSKDKYMTLANSPGFTRQTLSEVFDVKAENIKILYLPDLKVVKVSVPRKVIQGSPYDTDMHGGQQYVSVLDLEL